MKMLLVAIVSFVSLNVFAGSNSRWAYQISNAGNCKLMQAYGSQLTYIRNVDFTYCSPIAGYGRGGDAPYVQYEWSNKGNCKIMINEQFIRLTDEYLCRVND